MEYLRIGDHAPYLFRTRDFGKTWTKIVNGLPTDEPSGSFARVVRADPKKAGLQFAGTESGVCMSINDGDVWQPLQLNLPNTPVRDLLIKGNDLLAATHGRGAWVIDDISRLRQLTPAVASAIANAPAFLFAPGVTTRVRRNVNADTPLPPEIPHALNALDGVIVDYWLGAAAEGMISLDVLNAAGAVVRHYSSAPISPVPEAARPNTPNMWLAVPAPLPASRGMHRVNWDLREDAPSVFTHSFEINANPGLTPASPEGALVPPGVYTIRLTVNGKVVTRSVSVRNDPRSTAAATAVSAQYALTSRITAGLRASYEDGQHVASVRSAIEAASGANATAEVRAAIGKLRAAIDSVVGDAASGSGRGNGAAPARPTFRGANGALSAQLLAQDNADWFPTTPMQAAFKRSCRDLAGLHASWRAVLTREVPLANAVLVKPQLAPVSVPKDVAVPTCH